MSLQQTPPAKHTGSHPNLFLSACEDLQSQVTMRKRKIPDTDEQLLLNIRQELRDNLAEFQRNMMTSFECLFNKQNDSISKLHDELSTLKRQITDMQNSNSSLQQEQCEMKKCVSELEKRHELTSSDVSKLKKDLADTKINVKNLTEQLLSKELLGRINNVEISGVPLIKEDYMISLKNISEGVPEEYLSHKEKYEQSIKKSVAMFSLVRQLQKDGKTTITNYRDVITKLLRASLVRDGSPLGLHYIMFMPAIMNQANEEQQDKWLPRAWNSNIIGSYAQTELGHGTFIRGLETTATYDPNTKEFILHSPTLTSYKWWPGGLGHTANYCILVAQLYTKGKCHGVHSFIVQLRDEETHAPLPGIKIGDIGAKLGLNEVNNGFVGFDHVRIPRDHMLMKHAQVSEDGTYVKSLNNKLNYGAMVMTRVVIVFDIVNYLCKAVIIATRYSAVRRQSQRKVGEPEAQIIDYLTQQHKLFPAIATCHAIRIAANKLWDIFSTINEQLLSGNLERLPELHALSCCLKAVSTADAARCVERCRLACGGHGYMMSSNLPLTYGLVTAACTYEGENTVLLLQTARFLAKTWQQVDSGKLPPTVEYLKNGRNETHKKWENSVEHIISAFQIVSRRKMASCVENMEKRVTSGLSLEEAWNMNSIQLVSAAEIHCRVVILSTFNAEIKVKTNGDVSPELAVVLNQLLELYSLYWSLEKLSDLMQYTSISQDDVDRLKWRYEDILSKLRPNAVGLVDGFDIRDNFLHSTLGAYDGRVYERLMEEALKCPLNAETVNESFHQYLKPFMQGKL